MSWLTNLIPSWLQTAISGVTGSPILVIIATVVLGVGGFFAWGFIKKWLQAGKNVENAAQVQTTAVQVSTENQSINNEVDEEFNNSRTDKSVQ